MTRIIFKIVNLIYLPLPHHYYYIYLGFDKKIESGPILIYVSLIEERNYDDVGEQLNFYYYSSTGWKKLYVEDGTNYFTRKWIHKTIFTVGFSDIIPCLARACIG